MLITVFIGTIAAVLLLIFALFTFKEGKNSRLSNLFLSLFLFSNFMLLLDFVFPEIAAITQIGTIEIITVGKAFCLLFGPTLLLFTRSITDNEYSFNTKSALHFIPFAIALPIFLFSIEELYFYFLLFFNIHVFIYLFYCIRVINNYRNRIKQLFSSIDKINFQWLIYILGAFIIMWLLDFVNLYLNQWYNINTSIGHTLTFFSVLINLVFIVFLFYKALQQPQFLSNYTDNFQQKYSSSTLADNQKEEHLEKLNRFYLEEQPYLNSSLTISDVSESIGISVKNLSQVINEIMQKNFYDYSNSFRIELAKKQLMNPENDRKTVLEILYDVGFNSKSAFNTAFKKHTGATPTEFRRQHRTI